MSCPNFIKQHNVYSVELNLEIGSVNVFLKTQKFDQPHLMQHTISVWFLVV